MFNHAVVAIKVAKMRMVKVVNKNLSPNETQCCPGRENRIGVENGVHVFRYTAVTDFYATYI